MRRGELLDFALSIGPEQVGPGRSSDKVRLRTGPIGRRAGKLGYEAPIVRQVVEIGGVGIAVPGASGSVRFAADLRSGVAAIGGGDARATVTFRC